MTQVDSTLVVCVVRGHVICADLVVERSAWAPDSGDNVIATLQLGHVLPNFLNNSERLMAYREIVKSGRGCAVFCCIDFLVGAIDADAQDLHQYTATIWNL